MNCDFFSPQRIIFGKFEDELPKFFELFGKRTLLITGSRTETALNVADMAKHANIDAHIYSISGEPTIDSVEETAEYAKQLNCTAIVAIGGGSVLDTAKIVGALCVNSGSLMNFVEVIGENKQLQHKFPFTMALPTTSGSGSEVTKNAVVRSNVHGAKASMRSEKLFFDLVLVDSRLTHSLPPRLTAETGLDALTQLIEPFVSTKGTPFSDAFAREGLMRINPSLERACIAGDDAIARANMSIAALCGGFALAQGGLGAVHGLAAAFGGTCISATHGAICAALLPHVTLANIFWLEELAPDSPFLAKYSQVVEILSRGSMTGANNLPPLLFDLAKRIKIRSLRELGVCETMFADVVERAKKASSMKGNPIWLDDEVLFALLRNAF